MSSAPSRPIPLYRSPCTAILHTASVHRTLHAGARVAKKDSKAVYGADGASTLKIKEVIDFGMVQDVAMMSCIHSGEVVVAAGSPPLCSGTQATAWWPTEHCGAARLGTLPQRQRQLQLTLSCLKECGRDPIIRKILIYTISSTPRILSRLPTGLRVYRRLYLALVYAIEAIEAVGRGRTRYLTREVEAAAVGA